MTPQDLTGRPATPNEFAKWAVLTWGHAARHWRDRVNDAFKTTPLEGSYIDAAISKQIGRVEKFLGLDS